jgi:hypothetical protein
MTRFNVCLLVGLLGAPLLAQAGAPPADSGQTAAPRPVKPGQASAAAKSAGTPTHYLPSRFAGRAGASYKVVWGIDALKVKWAESGEIVRFSWRVLDPQLAQVLGDKKAERALIDPRAGVSLVIPAVENIGQLRQSGPPEAGKAYWMAFSNKGRLVKRGDRVDVVIGTFRAQGLVVD